MAERYNFKFANENDRDRMLFLSDIKIDENKVVEIPEEENKDILEEVSELSKNSDNNVIELFKELHKYILELNNSISYSITKNYISYSLGKCFAEIHFKTNFIKMFIMAGDYNDPENKVERLGENYNWTNNNRLDVHSFEKMDYIKNIIKQSFDKII